MKLLKKIKKKRFQSRMRNTLKARKDNKKLLNMSFETIKKGISRMDSKKYNEYQKKNYPEIKKIDFMDTSCDKCGTNLTLIEKIAINKKIALNQSLSHNIFPLKIIALCNKCNQYYELNPAFLREKSENVRELS